MTEQSGHSNGPASGARPEESRTDPVVLRNKLESWLQARPELGPDARVVDLTVPESNGMSSETVLFDVDPGNGEIDHLVARIAPLEASVPVFPVYDMESQFRVMAEVAGVVPVPAVRWLELDPAAIGAPFFVMDRVNGLVPPDVMPYNFGDSWVFDATPEQQRQMQDASVAVLAALHGIENPTERFAFLDPGGEGSALRRHVASTRRFYEWVVEGQRRSPLIEACFERLEATWPTDESPTVLSWGDSRIGNTMYEDFAPVAVLDWEMASLGPCEIDLAWMVFLHRFFEDIAHVMELPGMGHFMQRADIESTYEQLTGHAPRDMQWHLLYAALRHGAVMYRVQCRTIAFGEGEWPEDVDDLIMHRAALEQMLAGTYID